jgi:AbrB family looped-hinge helix DNA binding protein
MRLVDVVRALQLKNSLYSVIPAELRAKYGIKSGTRLIVSDAGDGIHLQPDSKGFPFERKPALHDVLKAAREGRVVLGDTLQGGEGPYELDLTTTLNSHAVITGDSGSGKTKTVMALIVRDWLATGVPCLVFDWHGEYSPLIEAIGGKVYRAGEDFHINPLSAFGQGPAAGIAAAEMLCRVLGLTAPQTPKVIEAAREAYEEKGILEKDPSTWTRPAPTLRDILSILEGKFEQGYYEGEDVERVRWILAKFHHVARAVGKDVFTFPKIPICINSTSLIDDLGKRVASEFAIFSIMRQQEGSDKRPEGIRIVLDDTALPDALLEGLVRSGRKLGISAIGTSRTPTDIPEPVLANCVVITHRTPPVFWNFMARVLGITRSYAKSLGDLRVGVAFVRQQGKPGPDVVQVQRLSQAEIDAAREKTQQALKEE